MGNCASKRLIFVYGTQKRGFPNHKASGLHDRESAEYLGPGTLKRAVLRNLMGVPMVGYDGDSSDKVHGEVYDVLGPALWHTILLTNIQLGMNVEIRHVEISRVVVSALVFLFPGDIQKEPKVKGGCWDQHNETMRRVKGGDGADTLDVLSKR